MGLFVCSCTLNLYIYLYLVVYIVYNKGVPNTRADRYGDVTGEKGFIKMEMDRFKILKWGVDVNVIQSESDAAFTPYILKDQMIYNPRDGFKPVNGEKRQRKLADMFLPEAEALLIQAEQVWNEQPLKIFPVKTKVVQAIEPIASEPQPFKGFAVSGSEPQPTVVESKQPQNILNDLISKSVAQISVNDVIEQAKPVIDEYIQKTYGALPIVHEFRVNDKPAAKITGIVHEKFDKIFDLIMLDIPVFLQGPAGTGKTELCRQLAEAAGIDFYSSSSLATKYDAIGFMDAHSRYNETQFYKAFKDGGLILIDEMDSSSPEALVAINTAISQRAYDFPCGRIKAHDNFRIVAAGNTWGMGADIEYTGRYQLDASTLDRFAKMKIDYSPQVEEALANGDKELLSFVRDFRKATAAAMIKIVVSMRAIERIAKLSARWELDEVLETCLTGSLAKDDLTVIYQNMKKKENRYADALRGMIA